MNNKDRNSVYYKVWFLKTGTSKPSSQTDKYRISEKENKSNICDTVGQEGRCKDKKLWVTDPPSDYRNWELIPIDFQFKI